MEGVRVGGKERWKEGGRGGGGRRSDSVGEAGAAYGDNLILRNT
jgi:hypothetical protein